MVAFRGLQTRFLQIAEIGGSQKARRSALAHAMRHGNKRACMEKYSKARCMRICAMPCACAYGTPSDTKNFLVWRVDGHAFFSENDDAERSEGVHMYLRKEQITHRAIRMAGLAATATLKYTQISSCQGTTEIAEGSKSKNRR